MDTVTYQLDDGIATIRIDDGKRNALPPAVLTALYAAFDQAEQDRASVILTGRDDVFSAGFDLHVMKRGGMPAMRMLKLGYNLPAKVLAHPYPVITACNGHCFAMGIFLMLASDYIIATRGDYHFAANEVAIGLPMPRVAAAMLKHRLEPAAAQRAITLAEYFDVDAAVAAGFADTVVAADQLPATAVAAARKFAELDSHAHAISKRRIRKATIKQLRSDARWDLYDAALLGLRGAKPKRS